MAVVTPPVGVSLASDVEYREKGPKQHRARVRSRIHPTTKRRRSKSESFGTEEEGQQWIDAMTRAAPS